MIIVMGHTDSDPIKRTAPRNSSNWELSAKRAARVVEQLEKFKVESKVLEVRGYSFYRPLKGKSKSAQRRVEIKIIK